MSSKKPVGKLAQSIVSKIVQNVTEKNAAADREKKKEPRKRSRQPQLGSKPASAPAAPAVRPIGQQLLAVVELAKEQRRALTFKEVLAQAKVDIEGNAQLLAALQRNEVLAVDTIARNVRYRTKYNITSKAELHDIIRRNPFGLNANELKDSYREAAADLDALVAAQNVFQCQSRDYPDVYIVYPNDLKLAVEVDEDMRALLQSVELPQEETLIDVALKAAGIKKAKRSTPRLKLTVLTDNQPKTKKRKQAAIRRVTNAHMPELFQGELATQID